MWIPKMTGYRALIEGQCCCVLRRHNYRYAVSQGVSKLNEAIRPQPGDVNNRQFAIVQSFENFSIDKTMLRCVRTHFDSTIAYLLDDRINDFPKESLN